MVMIEAEPGRPAVLPARFGYAYRGDPWGFTIQFPEEYDTTGWDMAAHVRRYPDSDEILAECLVETNYQGEPRLVRVSLTGEETALLPPAQLEADLEHLGDRTYVQWTLDVDPDKTRVVTE